MRARVEARPERSGTILQTAVENIALTDLEGEATQAVVASWKQAKGLRSMPQRADFTLRTLGRAAQSISLLRVVDDDYEFRIVGDAHMQAYAADFQQRRLSDVMQVAPRYGRRLRAFLDLVRNTGKPFAVRGFIGDDVADARFSWFETVFLPLGDGGIVDHIINSAIYTPRGGRWPP